MTIFDIIDDSGLPFKRAEFNIEDALIEEEIIVDKKIELENVFVFSNSVVNINLLEDSREAFGYLKQENGFGNPKMWIGILLVKDGVNKFWGYIEPESLYRDVINGTISFTVIDWYKWIREYLEIPIAGRQSYILADNLLTTLTLNFDCDIINGFNIKIGDISTSLEPLDYRFLSAFGLKRSELLFEYQKHYGAFIYVDENKVLNIINRGAYIDNIIIDNDIIEATGGRREDYLIDEFTPSDYNSILINVKGAWNNTSPGVWQQWSGWAYVKQIDGDIDVEIGIDANLRQINDKEKYLDLRQNLEVDGESMLGGGSTVRILQYIDFYTPVILNPVDSIGDWVIGKVLSGLTIQDNQAFQFFGHIVGYEIQDSTHTILYINEWVGVNFSFNTPITTPNAHIYKINFTKLRRNFNQPAAPAFRYFVNRDAVDRWRDFVTVFYPQRKISVSVLRTDIRLFNKVSIGDEFFYVINSREYIKDGYMELEIISIPNVNPNILGKGNVENTATEEEIFMVSE